MIKEIIGEDTEGYYRISQMLRLIEFDYNELLEGIGDLLKPNFLSQHFRIVQNRHNLKQIRFHDLRHSCASLMLANGVPMKQIQEWLGHSIFQTTADIYARLDFSSKLSSANAISTALDFEEKKENDLDNEIEELEKLLEKTQTEKET